jgi:5-methylcytosine-specific restriction endonuclease McrA
MTIQKVRKPRKKKVQYSIEEWAKKKAVSARNSWRSRAKALGLDLQHVPTRKEIEEWILQQVINGTINDYLTDTEVNLDVAEMDHKIPVYRNGSFSLSNVGITCRYYNNAKGTMTEHEFRQLLNLVKDWEDKGSYLMKRLLASNRIYRR